MPSQFENYYGYVSSEAESFVSEHFNDLLDEIRDGYTDVSNFVNDSRLHEWCDNDFIYVDLLDSALILDQSNEIETDSGLWEGQEPKDAIQTQAFFTYMNDVRIEIADLLSKDLGSKLEELEAELSELENEDIDQDDEEEVESMELKIEELQDFINNIEDAIQNV